MLGFVQQHPHLNGHWKHFKDKELIERKGTVTAGDHTRCSIIARDVYDTVYSPRIQASNTLRYLLLMTALFSAASNDTLPTQAARPAVLRHGLLGRHRFNDISYHWRTRQQFSSHSYRHLNFMRRLQRAGEVVVRAFNKKASFVVDEDRF